MWFPNIGPVRRDSSDGSARTLYRSSRAEVNLHAITTHCDLIMQELTTKHFYVTDNELTIVSGIRTEYEVAAAMSRFKDDPVVAALAEYTTSVLPVPKLI